MRNVNERAAGYHHKGTCAAYRSGSGLTHAHIHTRAPHKSPVPARSLSRARGPRIRSRAARPVRTVRARRPSARYARAYRPAAPSAPLRHPRARAVAPHLGVCIRKSPLLWPARSS